MRYIDTHAHVNFTDYDADRAAVIARAREAGVGVINVGTDKETSQRAVELAEAHEDMWATVGLHPNDTEEAFDYDWYKTFALHRRVVAIGECGFDQFRSPEVPKFQKQEEVFRKQIELANEVGKPLMLHVRNAYREAYEILKTHAKVKGNLHFFAGDMEEAKLFLNRGFSFSFTGVLTFTRDYDEVIRYLPLERIMAETDCPFVAPVPYRGKRNEPALVTEVVRAIAAIRDEDLEKVRAQLVENAKTCYALAHVS